MNQRRHPTPSPSNSVMKIAGVLLAVLGLVLAGVGYYAWNLTEPVEPNATEKQTFVIPRGQSVSAVADNLAEANLIKSPWAFRFAVWQQNLTGKIQAGSFLVSPGMDVFGIARRLTEGTDDVWVTIQEGWRAEQIGQYLESELSQFDTNSTAFTSECLTAEGFLFPETYLVPRGYDTKQMCDLLKAQYGEVFTFDLREQATANTGLNDEQVVILASIVQREAKDPEQMRHVAGILLNRLEIGMALQVDATLQYAKGYDPVKETWWPTPTAADKEVDSPYNTYLNQGLPPAPISNPGLDALMAVVNPLESDELYYLHAPDGSMYYAETYEGHQANIDRYLR